MSTTIDRPKTVGAYEKVRGKQVETLQAIRSFRGPCSRQQIVDIIGRDPARDINRLLKAGLITAEGKGRDRRFTSTTENKNGRRERVRISEETERTEVEGLLRVKVIDLIRRDRTARSVGRLAQLLLVAPDSVEVAVEQLIDAGRVWREEDGSLAAISARDERARRHRERTAW